MTTAAVVCPLTGVPDGAMHAVAGTIAAVDHAVTRQGFSYAVGRLDTDGGPVLFEVPPAHYGPLTGVIQVGAVVMLSGRVDHRPHTPTLTVTTAATEGDPR